MQMKIVSTKDQHIGNVTMLVYGHAGSGKTMMAATADNPLIIDVEHGLLSLVGHDIDAISVSSMADFREAFAYAKAHAADYGCICIDSLSELAEIILTEEKEIVKDPRMAYMSMAEVMTKIIRSLKTMRQLVYCTAKAELHNDDGTGMSYFAPSFPGSKLSNQIPYQFDVVGAMRADMVKGSNEIVRYVQTANDGKYIAKDRTGKLDAKQAPSIHDMMVKIFGEDNGIS
jgi:hypothetical protein